MQKITRLSQILQLLPNNPHYKKSAKDEMLHNDDGIIGAQSMQVAHDALTRLTSQNCSTDTEKDIAILELCFTAWFHLYNKDTDSAKQIMDDIENISRTDIKLLPINASTDRIQVLEKLADALPECLNYLDGGTRDPYSAICLPLYQIQTSDALSEKILKARARKLYLRNVMGAAFAIHNTDINNIQLPIYNALVISNPSLIAIYAKLQQGEDVSISSIEHTHAYEFMSLLEKGFNDFWDDLNKAGQPTEKMNTDFILHAAVESAKAAESALFESFKGSAPESVKQYIGENTSILSIEPSQRDINSAKARSALIQKCAEQSNTSHSKQATEANIVICALQIGQSQYARESTEHANLVASIQDFNKAMRKQPEPAKHNFSSLIYSCPGADVIISGLCVARTFCSTSRCSFTSDRPFSLYSVVARYLRAFSEALAQATAR